MDEFGYLSVLLSIILGLSVTQLLQGLAGIIQARTRVRLYWPAVGWAILLLAADAQAWWAMFGLRQHHPWTFLQFAIVLLETIVLYLLAALVLPSFAGDEVVDLRANYFGHARWFFGAFVALLVVSLVKDKILAGAWPVGLNLAFHFVFIAGVALAAVSRSDRFHRVFVCYSAILFAAYIALLFARLR
jgi:hypothetical protein